MPLHQHTIYFPHSILELGKYKCSYPQEAHVAVPFLDFDAIKKSVTTTEMMALSGVKFTKVADGEYRAECPVHKGGKRSLVVNLYEKDGKGDPGCFYCHGAKEGGDRVSLVAHVRDSKPYAVFKEIAERNPVKPEASPEEKDMGSGERGFRPLPYLEPEHPSVLALGISPDVAKAIGAGYSPRGFHRGRIAIPVRLADGSLAGYLSITADTSVQLPPKWFL